MTKQVYEDGDTVTYAYDNNGALATITDSATGRTTTYYYDFTDRLMKYTEKGTNYSHSVGYEYDDINNLTALVDTINGVKYTTSYAYDKDNRVTSVTAGSAVKAYTYDAYSRVSSRVTSHNGTTILKDKLTYRSPTSTTTTGQIWKLQSTADEYDELRTYTYDANGNITSVYEGLNTTSYVYDTANQLIRENNQKLGKTWVWTYDDGGNILSRSEYAYTTGTLGTATDTVNYTYGDSSWGDLLTGYDGTTITHDQIGNPLNDGTWTYTWEHGRQLMSMYGEDINGGINDVTIDYQYNADGLRTKKTVTTRNYTTHQHNYTTVVTEPTCTEDGYTTYTCACGDTYTDDVTEALGHTYTSVVTPPTCTETGYTTYTCHCGDSYQGDPTPATGHNHISTVIAPTCTQIGYTLHSCACGDSYQTDETAALGHDLTETVMEPSDGSIDNVLYECTRCDYSCTGHTHVYTTTVVDPTCTEAGYTRNACICGDTYQSDPTPATGHTYTAVVTAPTCTEAGYTTYTCHCGDSYQGDPTPATGHTYTSVVTPPTCTEKGYTTHTCHCGDSYQDNLIDALGHHYYTNKYGIELCSRCGDILETIPLLPDPTPGEEIMSAGVGTATMAIAESTERTLDSTIVQEYGYVYTGGKLMQMVVKTTTTPADGEPTTTTETLNFTYDASGAPMSVKYGGTDYYYVANIQGDILAILNTSGEAVVKYTYDAWGKLYSTYGTLADTLGEVNPLRYRGYVYDNETEYYYLQSRYYNPEIGRFINADGFASTGCGLLGNNMFAYCNNNPVAFADNSGHAPWPCTKIYSEGGGRSQKHANPYYYNDPSSPYYEMSLLNDTDIISQLSHQGVSYRVDKTKVAERVKITNSYMITDIGTMVEYAEQIKKTNPDAFSGSVTGFVFEWWIHSSAYYLCLSTGNVKWQKRMADADFGNTIYDDNHDGLSTIMWAVYGFIFSESAQSDKIIHALG